VWDLFYKTNAARFIWWGNENHPRMTTKITEKGKTEEEKG
jgi:hypothetical protein